MRKLLALLLIAFSFGGATTTASAAPMNTCSGKIFVGPDFEDTAWAFQVSGTSCIEAGSVAMESRKAGAPFDVRTLYTWDGFACLGKFQAPKGQKGWIAFRCYRANAVITFRHG